MRSREIIRAVAAKHKLQPYDLLGHDRFGHFVAARREAMLRLREAGFSYPQIGAFLGRDHSTVVFHVNQAMRQRKLRYARDYMRRRASEARE